MKWTLPQFASPLMSMSVRLTVAATAMGSSPKASKHTKAGLTNRYGVMLSRGRRPPVAGSRAGGDPVRLGSAGRLTLAMVSIISPPCGPVPPVPPGSRPLAADGHPHRPTNPYFCRFATSWLSFARVAVGSAVRLGSDRALLTVGSSPLILNQLSWVAGSDRKSRSFIEASTLADLCQTPMLEPANSAVPALSAGSGATAHLPARLGACSETALARYGPEISIGAAPEMKPWAWSKSDAVGTSLSR